MQIDTNCDKTVDLGELTDFVLNKNQSLVSLDCKNHPFPKPFIVIPVAHYKAIVSLLFCPIEEELDSDFEIGETRTYQKGHYFSISSDGIFTLWSDSFDTSYTIPLYKTKKTIPYSHEKKMHITDMVYIKELKQVAQLVTGGTDGLLRVWFPHKTVCCQHVLRGHTKPISHIMANHKDKLLITKCLGRGTDIFKNMLTSHDKLITVSDDGKVRLWNFNNGKQLAVLPVTVPKEVTGIVCVNNRLFVSAKNSKVIYDLDMEKNYNRFLEHDYLNDIISMDVHETTLVTGSSNGTIVVYDPDTAEALYCIDATNNPRTQLGFGF
uniref:Uncharacterized protein n=1 Tax=Anabas testudineus TaxID=64144 RepID=A0A7N6BCH2_ANATE